MSHVLTVDEARETPLMGQPGSWDGYGSKPLDVVPDKMLRKARGWFSQKVREQPAQYKPKVCTACGNSFTPHGPRAKRCEACRA